MSQEGDRGRSRAGIGVCSWSLRPRSPSDLARRLRTVGVDRVQLALEPLRAGAWSERATLDVLRENGIEPRSGMIGMRGEDYSSLESIRRTGGVRPDEHWSANLAAARESAALARRLALPLVSFHAGFLPHERGARERAVMLERLRAIVDAFAEQGVHVAFETGQESAATLLDVLADLERPSAGVNFDPANLILYDMGDPVAALRALAPRVLQIHVKDARRALVPGTWGEEVPVGDGEVDWRAFADVLASSDLACDLMIEREAGGDRDGDIALARRRIEDWLGPRAAEAR